MLGVFVLTFFGGLAGFTAEDAAPVATREFEIRNDRAFLGGSEVKLWGVRCGNALHSWTVTERHVRALDNMCAHGVNCIGVYIQGSNGGWPKPDAGRNGFTRDGKLKGDFGLRLEWLVREADKRGMVVMVGLFSPRKDQDFYDEAAIKLAVEQAGQFLTKQKLRNTFVDIMHEFDHSERIDQEIFREPNSVDKKAKLAKWFKDAAPGIEVGVCPYEKSAASQLPFPGMDVHIIQKQMEIPKTGFVVNVETLKQDSYENDGVFNAGSVDFVKADCARYLAAKNSAMLFHAAYIQGITNFSGTAPHPEIGGYGETVGDRGVRFYFDWVRDNVGEWKYPHHVPVKAR